MTEPTTIQIVRGEPTPEELAALVAVLTAAAASAPSVDPAPAAPSGWTDRSRYVRGALPHAANGWRSAAFPR